MKQRNTVLLIGFFLLFTVPTIHAGEVITDGERLWAKQAIEQEQALEGAPASNTVAVLTFGNPSADPGLVPLQKGFAYLLMTDLSQVQGLTVVERVRIQALLEELKLGASGLVDEASAPRVGRLSGAGYLVGGDLSGKDRAGLSVSSDVLQVKDQSSLGRPSADGALEQVFELEKKILFEVVDLLKIKLSKKERESLKRPLTTSYQALIYLSMGLDASDRGNYTRADLFYRKALALDPQFSPAARAREELQALRLVPVNPQAFAILARQEEQNSSTDSLSKDDSTFREFKPATTGQIRVTW
ncbi:MAG TPA: CsgG/HfaB family protein [Deltaproteobacteria bacterium]|nr:CsgG/HfaB family protein [Deltaproteobacteria bacterium]HQI81239.1 CsgG/HfaB family protein [Deltaproteobacteria bacterium]